MKKFFILVVCLSMLMVNAWAAQPEIGQQITIHTADGKEIKVAKAVAQLSNTIKDQVVQTGEDKVELTSKFCTYGTISTVISLMTTLYTIQAGHGSKEQIVDVLNTIQPLLKLASLLELSNYLDVEQLTFYIVQEIARVTYSEKDLAAIITLKQLSPDMQQQLTSVLISRSLLILVDIFKALAHPLILQHTSSVLSIAISHNGKQALIGSDIAHLWDLDTGNIIKELTGHTRLVSSVAISPDGKQALIGYYDGAVRLWDLETGNIIAELVGHTGWITSVAISANGKQALTGSYDTIARLWNLETRETLKVLQAHTNKVTSVAISPNGKQALTGSDDKTVRYWNLETGETIKELIGHASYVTSVAISCEGKQALTGSLDYTARLWDLSTGNTIIQLKGHTSPVWSVAISPDGKQALTGYDDYTACLWDLSTGKTIILYGPSESAIVSVAFSPDSTHVLLAEGNDAVYLPLMPKLTLEQVIFLIKAQQEGLSNLLTAKEYQEIFKSFTADQRQAITAYFKQYLVKYFRLWTKL